VEKSIHPVNESRVYMTNVRASQQGGSHNFGREIVGVESESHSCQRNATLNAKAQGDASRVD
jgi:hypothetical protein